MMHYTKDELVQVHKERLEELILFAKGISFLSKMLDIPVSTIQGWVLRERISKAGANAVSKNRSLNKKFTAKYLRPDMK